MNWKSSDLSKNIELNYCSKSKCYNKKEKLRNKKKGLKKLKKDRLRYQNRKVLLKTSSPQTILKVKKLFKQLRKRFKGIILTKTQTYRKLASLHRKTKRNSQGSSQTRKTRSRNYSLRRIWRMRFKKELN